MQVLRFLHSARPSMLVDICMKFHDGLKVIERTRSRQDFVRDKVPREIAKKHKRKSYGSALCMSPNIG